MTTGPARPAPRTCTGMSRPAARWRSSRTQVEVLEHSESVESFNHQMDLLKRRLLTEPRAFRELFISEGMQAVAWEFGQPGAGAGVHPRPVVDAAARGRHQHPADAVPLEPALGQSACSSAAIDAHLSDRYPMFDGLSQGLARGQQHPAVRARRRGSRPRLRAGQPGLPGLRGPGLHRARHRPARLAGGPARQAVLGQAPCELGVFLNDVQDPRAAAVPIHIPEVLELVGNGRLRSPARSSSRATRCPTSRAGSARRSCSARASASRKLPIAIGQLEWFLPQREKLVDPGGALRRSPGAPTPGGLRSSRRWPSSAPGRPG